MSNVYIKTKVRSGHGALSCLNEFYDKRILIVCDRFMVESKSICLVTDMINSTNQVDIFDQVVPDPTTEVVGKGLAAACRILPDVVVGFGGGSAIDTAKGIIYFAKEQGLFAKPVFVTIPTTSGTGSEVTSATVITDLELKSKHLVADDDILADLAILDAQLTLSVPPVITANTGMDVMTHALEAYVARNANVFSDALAEKAVELLLGNLLTCYLDGTQIEARTWMHEASTLAGMAFNTAGLGANHAIAHQLGGTFHIPHGLANAILLKEIISFNCRDCKLMKKYAQLAWKTRLASPLDSPEYSVKALVAAVDILMDAMHMPRTIQEAGIGRQDFVSQVENMASNALKDTCMGAAVVKPDMKEVRQILCRIYGQGQDF